MLNKRPIFIMGFAYGGSNILLNFLRSHPDVCSPRGEFNEVFKGKLDEPVPTRVAKCMRYLPCLLSEGYDFSRFNSWVMRPRLRPFTQKWVDRILFDEKLRARSESQNLYKMEQVEYGDEEILSSRLLCKCLDGLILLSDELREMYPDAVFFGLVRNGFAVCEGHLRRGYDFETIARHYDRGCQKMINDSKTIPNYHIVRYEDIVAEPRRMLENIYEMADLDIRKVEKVRLETKKVIQGNGKHEYVRNAGRKELVWYGLDEFHNHFRPDANDNQIKRLSGHQRFTIIRHSERSLKHFSYL